MPLNPLHKHKEVSDKYGMTMITIEYKSALLWMQYDYTLQTTGEPSS